MIFVATRNGRTKKFSPSSFGAVVGSGMDKNQDPGYTSRIRNTGKRYGTLPMVVQPNHGCGAAKLGNEA
jgi:hypothetical protein